MDATALLAAMDENAWIAIAGLVLTVFFMPAIGGLIHIVWILRGLSSDVSHILTAIEGGKKKQDEHEEKLGDHEVRIVRLEGK